MSSNTKEVARYLQENIDWKKFTRLVHSVGDQLDFKQYRFLKAYIMEKAVEFYSLGKLVYVSDIGCDFIIPEMNTNLEMKFTRSGAFKKNGKLRKTVQIILFNGIGGNTTRLPDSFADFLMLCSSQGAVVFDKATLVRHSRIHGDKIYAVLPPSKGVTVCMLEKPEQTVEKRDFRESLDKMVTNLCMSV